MFSVIRLVGYNKHVPSDVSRDETCWKVFRGEVNALPSEVLSCVPLKLPSFYIVIKTVVILIVETKHCVSLALTS